MYDSTIRQSLRGHGGVKKRAAAYNTVVNQKSITITLSNGYAGWLDCDASRTCFADEPTRGEKSMFFERSRKTEDELVALYLSGVKKYVFLPIVESFRLQSFESGILLHTLVAFDRERDELLVRAKLRESQGKIFSLDGFYNFRLGELKKRWRDLAAVARENAPLLYDEDSFNVVVRFLLSAVTPRTNEVLVGRNDNGYFVSEDGVKKYLGGYELICELVDVAPMSVSICGDMPDEEITDRIYGIFDVKDEVSRTHFC